jgi:DNA adenine methylase
MKTHDKKCCSFGFSNKPGKRANPESTHASGDPAAMRRPPPRWTRFSMKQTQCPSEAKPIADVIQVKKPFLKWAGGKTKVVPVLKPLLPCGRGRLIEPFVGAGALFLNTEYPNSFLCDSNADLMCVYAFLQEHSAKFIQECGNLFTPENNQEERYYQLRAEFNQQGEPERHAALFVYLNRHAFNGLCRFNRTGQFNVPFGLYDKPYFPREEMETFAARLQTAFLEIQDFRVTLAQSGDDDVVYADPPYVPLSATANFTDYASGGFSLEDQKDLAACAIQAAQRGATVIISNHDTPLTRELYQDASQIITLQVRRNISCDGNNRGKAKELIAVF